MSVNFEWVVPTTYGQEVSILANDTTDTNLLTMSTMFDAYATDDITVIAVKGHICFTEANAATPEMNVFGWRVRLGLEDLQVGGSTYSGDIDNFSVADEHFLDERFWTQGTLGTSTTNMADAYYLRLDVKSKRRMKAGQLLGLSFYNDANVVRRLKRYIRIGVLLHR